MGQHFTFNGLVTRKQFWLNQLAVTLIMFASLAVGIGGAAAATTEAAAIFALFVMAVPIIGSAVSAWSYLARRVRDTGNSAMAGSSGSHSICRHRAVAVLRTDFEEHH